MTFEDLLDILAEQFSCDAAELSKDTSFEDLGVDAEDLVELAWQLGEATGTEVEEDRLKRCPCAQALCTGAFFTFYLFPYLVLRGIIIIFSSVHAGKGGRRCRSRNNRIPFCWCTATTACPAARTPCLPRSAPCCKPTATA